MKLFQTYLNKNASGDSLIQTEPENGLKYIVVIPAYIETRLNDSLVSIFNATPPDSPVEVIVLINWPEDESQENIKLSKEISESAKNFAASHSSPKFKIHVIEAASIPRKKAGVGYARKTGMDEAIRRFERSQQENGIIISFDADTQCEQNYVLAIEQHFEKFPGTDGCSIYFEHPLSGEDYKSNVYTAITQYELHMRYYLHAVKYSGFPNAFYTVGSAFAVRAESYCKQGGMNARQAGEDFYFLQKFFDLGNFTDLLSTTIKPSPRPSLRVPFGTGKAVVQILESGGGLHSYNPEIFKMLKVLFEKIPEFYTSLSTFKEPNFADLPSCLHDFLQSLNIISELKNIFENSGSLPAFEKRFYRYFNMFRILKFARFARNFFPDLPVKTCAESLFQMSEIQFQENLTERELLVIFREIDRNS